MTTPSTSAALTRAPAQSDALPASRAAAETRPGSRRCSSVPPRSRMSSLPRAAAPNCRRASASPPAPSSCTPRSSTPSPRAAYERARSRRPERKAQIATYGKLRRIRRPERVRAAYLTSDAIRDGRLVRQPCEVCGTTLRVQAHHDDYTKPLDVRWLCFKHHREHHGQVVIAA
jgi:hypothetical protein